MIASIRAFTESAANPSREYLNTSPQRFVFHDEHAHVSSCCFHEEFPFHGTCTRRSPFQVGRTPRMVRLPVPGASGHTRWSDLPPPHFAVDAPAVGITHPQLDVPALRDSAAVSDSVIALEMSHLACEVYVSQRERR